MTVSLVWVTPDLERMITYIARVSNPEFQDKDDTRLLGYCIRKRHWSVFEMANICTEFTTERDVTRQLLRHGLAFRFQEFSQRYQTVDKLPPAPLREARMQHPTNRQASMSCDDEALAEWWRSEQQRIVDLSNEVYAAAVNRGMAKELARSVLPEGLTTSRIYLNGWVRSWLHFSALRTGNGTQPETQRIAKAGWEIVGDLAPTIADAWREYMPHD